MAKDTSPSDVVFVVDQLPYPPRNGITLPIYNYLCAIRESVQFRLVLLVDVANRPEDKHFCENQQIFGLIDVVYIRRRTLVARVFRELTCVEMYQHGWVADRALSGPHLHSLASRRIVVSPFSAAAKLRQVWSGGAKASNAIACVNDCTTAEYWSRYRQARATKRGILKGVLGRFRIPFIARVERKILRDYQAILVQTEKDRSLLGDLVLHASPANVLVAPNGVSAEFLRVEMRPNRNLIFVAELSGEYDDMLRWILCDVWPRVYKDHSDWSFKIIGKGASAELKALMDSCSGVCHTPYVFDLAAEYSECSISISPVFKGFGLINKTIEAMASALPVIGGAAAFNGIEGFVRGVHGVVCADFDADDLATKISHVMSDEKLRSAIGRCARELVANQFSWARPLSVLRSAISPPSR